MRGSSDPTESWKTICMSRARSPSCPSCESASTSTPSNSISPAVGSISRSSVRPSVDLPQPDSPTSPTVSPRKTSRSTPSTACTWPTVRCSIPLRTGKCFLHARAPQQDVRLRLRAVAPRPAPSARGARARTASTPTPAAATGKSGGLLRTHLVEHVVAARREAAALRPLERARDDAADRLQRLGTASFRAAGSTRAAPRCTGAAARRRCRRPGRARRPGRRT